MDKTDEYTLIGRFLSVILEADGVDDMTISDARNLARMLVDNAKSYFKDHKVAVDPPNLMHATNITYIEGGVWYEWPRQNPQVGEPQNIYAVKFDNGWIWDRVVGWRKMK